MKTQKGITLVALVITIAIMLILAGVTISVSLKGGLFSKANEATSQMQIEAEKEELLTAALGTLGRNGKVIFSDLDSNLPDNFTKIAEGKYKSSTGNTYQVTEDADIILLDGSEEEEEPETPVTPPANPTITLSTTQISREITNGTPETIQLTATLNNASGDLTWQTSDATVAEISGSGTTRTITLKKAGTAIITVKYGTQATATCNITVTEKEATVDDELAGTWVFNETITLQSDGTSYNLEFTVLSYETEYSYSKISFSEGKLGFAMNYDDSEVYYDALGWEFSWPKTISVLTTLSDMDNGEEFLTWLKANAVKQSNTLTRNIYYGTFTDRIVLTIEFEEGMTWGEWYESEYNDGSITKDNNGHYYLTGTGGIDPCPYNLVTDETIIEDNDMYFSGLPMNASSFHDYICYE